jgi:predicted TIM-barrel fold metal-dependent hydrolase
MPSLVHAHKKPVQTLPANVADCHMHVFGPFDRFPLAAARSYNVPDAPLATHEAMKLVVGLARTVLVQPSGYGIDNSCMLAALDKLGARGRGVAVVDADVPEPELAVLHAAGVRGVRLNLVSLRGRYGGDIGRLIAAFAARLAPRGWHLQIFADNAVLAELEPDLAAAAVDIVIDHMGLPDARAGLDQPGFQALRRLLGAGHIWAKLAGADRVTQHTGRLADALPYMHALAATNPDRLVWGSDWPHIGFHGGKAASHTETLAYRPLDAGELLDLLIAAVPDASTREKILSLNPARLYQFA